MEIYPNAALPRLLNLSILLAAGYLHLVVSHVRFASLTADKLLYLLLYHDEVFLSAERSHDQVRKVRLSRSRKSLSLRSPSPMLIFVHNEATKRTLYASFSVSIS